MNIKDLQMSFVHLNKLNTASNIERPHINLENEEEEPNSIHRKLNVFYVQF